MASVVSHRPNQPHKIVIVIPARLASSRLPRKLLLAETGQPLIQHTYEAAALATKAREVIVAADCEEIAAAVRSFGGRAELTDSRCASGTDRVAEIARRFPAYDLFVNLQGDEPEISSHAIDLTVEILEANAEIAMSTLAAPLRSKERLCDPACVKVVCDQFQRALYFSRAPIPFARDWDDSLLLADPPHFLQHIGIYAYRRDFLLTFASLPPAHLERVENLEQLRVLKAGQPIIVGIVAEAAAGVDTLSDYREFVARWRSRFRSTDVRTAVDS